MRPANPFRAPASARWVAALLAAAALVGCTGRYKKLSAGGSMSEVLLYDVLGQSRDPFYYYRLVEQSHEESTFCYRCGGDPFLVDKNIDAIHRLGDASYARLEGEAMVVLLLGAVLLEDRSALARAAAATSLTKRGAKLPPQPPAAIEDGNGQVLLATMQELDALAPGGGAPPALAGTGQGPAAIRRLGDLAWPWHEELTFNKQALDFLVTRRYLVDAEEPALRAAVDETLVRLMRRRIVIALGAAVEDPVASVRGDALRGLKTLGAAETMDAVLARLEMEPDWLVRIEAIEYLRRVGTAPAVAALLPLLDDVDPNVRHKARQALASLAGEDLGGRRATWTHWARRRHPGIELPEQPARAAGGDEGGAALLR